MSGSNGSEEKLTLIRSKLLQTGIELGVFHHLFESRSTDAAKGGKR